MLLIALRKVSPSLREQTNPINQDSSSRYQPLPFACFSPSFGSVSPVVLRIQWPCLQRGNLEITSCYQRRGFALHSPAPLSLGKPQQPCAPCHQHQILRAETGRKTPKQSRDRRFRHGLCSMVLVLGGGRHPILMEVRKSSLNSPASAAFFVVFHENTICLSSFDFFFFFSAL